MFFHRTHLFGLSPSCTIPAALPSTSSVVFFHLLMIFCALTNLNVLSEVCVPRASSLFPSKLKHTAIVRRCLELPQLVAATFDVTFTGLLQNHIHPSWFDTSPQRRHLLRSSLFIKFICLFLPARHFEPYFLDSSAGCCVCVSGPTFAAAARYGPATSTSRPLLRTSKGLAMSDVSSAAIRNTNLIWSSPSEPCTAVPVMAVSVSSSSSFDLWLSWAGSMISCCWNQVCSAEPYLTNCAMALPTAVIIFL